jgi:hypothetical protein
MTKVVDKFPGSEDAEERDGLEDESVDHAFEKRIHFDHLSKKRRGLAYRGLIRHHPERTRRLGGEPIEC